MIKSYTRTVHKTLLSFPYRKNLSDAEFTYDGMRRSYVWGSSAAPQLDAVSN